MASPASSSPSSLNINEQARKEANLRLLQRSTDRNITNILSWATHVVLYGFNSTQQQWVKSNVEGSFFLAERRTIPAGNSSSSTTSPCVLVIMNRNSPQNYVMELTTDFQVQASDPYLIFKNYSNDGTAATIRGVWFPNANERTQLFDVLSTTLDALQRGNFQPTTTATTTTTTTTPAVAPAQLASPAPIDTASATAALLASLNVGGGTTSAPSPNVASSSAAAPIPPNATPPRSGSSGSLRRQPSPQQQGQHQPTLDKKSLQLALLSLIQDDRFLDLLHAQYLKVHHARTTVAANKNPNNTTTSNNSGT